ncbi:MAG TPA: AsmA-like C-terminal region-containing protein [Candidatus Limnocylindria bacterium]|nr:AsmA-like C-terminal region-containing protein [Candidatus Limnocylindria bacterium]
MEPIRPKHVRVRKFVFRWCGRCALVGVVAVAGLGVYLNQVGVPFFAKDWLRDTFRSHGISLAFERVRVRLGRGIVAEKVELVSLKASGGEKVTAAELQLKLDWASVLRLEPEIEAIHLRDGSLEIPLPSVEGRPPSVAYLDNADSLIRLDARDNWVIENFTADLQGFHVNASGTITNAAYLWHRKPGDGGTQGQWKQSLARGVDILKRLGFAEKPEITLNFRADPQRPLATSAHVSLRAERPQTPWGRARQFLLDVGFNEAAGDEAGFRVKFRSVISRFDSKWGRADSLIAIGKTRFDGTNSLPEEVIWDVRAKGVALPAVQGQSINFSGVTRRDVGPVAAAAPFAIPSLARTGAWHTISTPEYRTRFEAHGLALGMTNINSARLDLDGELWHSTNAWHEAQWQLRSGPVQYLTNRLAGALLAGRVVPDENETAPRPDDGWWNYLSPFQAHASLVVTNIATQGVSLDSVTLTADYATNRLAVDQFRALLYDGEVGGSATVDVASRAVSATAYSRIDAHAFEPLLTEKGRIWMKQYGWTREQPPALEGTVAVVLPAWTNRQPDWRGEVMPTLKIQASLTATNVNFRGIPGDRATSHIQLDNQVWSLPDLVVHRPEGRLDLGLTDDTRTQRYRFWFRSTIDPRIGRDMILHPKGREAVDALVLDQPPVVTGEIVGQWHRVDLIGIEAQVAVTNASWRGEHVDSLETGVRYTNQVIEVYNAAVKDGAQHGTLGRLTVEIPTQVVTTEQVVSRFDPSRVTRLIGPKTHAMVEPFHFAAVPFVIMDGRFDKYGGDGSDVTFKVEAPGDFEWKKVHVTAPIATVHYIGHSVLITNFTSGFYGGELKGHLELDVSDPETTKVALQAHATNVDVHTLMSGLSPATNRLEGTLDVAASLSATDGKNPQTWRGSGNASLRDGFLWDVPLVGVFGPLLRTMSPDWGRARFTGGDATFTIADGKIKSTDLELKSSTMKLDYSGTVDLKGGLDAIMRAEMFRKVPVLGPIAGFALSPFEKLLEYKLTGSLKEPKAEPAYIPSFLLVPFHPIQTIKGLLPNEKRTNEPPAN